SVVSAFRRKQPCDDHDGDRRHVPPRGGNYRIHGGTIGGDTLAALAAIPSAPASVVSACRRKQPCDDHDGDRRHVPPKGGSYRIHEGTIGGDTRAALAANPVRSRFCSFRLQAEAAVRRPRWRSATRSA